MSVWRGHRRRRDGVRPARALARGLAVTAVIGLAAAVLLNASRGLPFASHYRLNVELPDAGSLRAGSPVDVVGVRVGQVVDKRPGPGGTALVGVEVQPSAAPLPAGTTARVRALGLLGARFLELTPGTSRRLLRSGGTIRGAGITNGLPEALRTFDARTRAALGDSIRSLGAGLADRGQALNAALADAPSLLADLQRTSDAVLSRGEAAAELLPSVRDAFTALDSAKDDMVHGFGPGADALRPFADRRADVRATLQAAPPALSAANRGLGDGRRLLATTRALAAAANQTLPAAPAALRASAALLRDARTPLRRARPLLDAAGETVPSLLTTTRALDPVFRPVGEGLSHLRAPVREVGRRRCDLDNFAENWRSMLGYGVRGGGRIGPLNSLRIEAIGSNESVAGLGPDAQAALLPKGAVVRNAYPAPCRYSPGPRYNVDRLSGRPRR
ncbi:MAG TPA: MlaD family protein [Solirubrobacteraceae bacterium]|jgi:virulence factor Mce-like protein